MNLKDLMEQYAETERAIEWAQQKQKAIKAAMSERIGVPVQSAFPNCNFITVVKRLDGMKVHLVPASSINDKPFQHYEMVIDGVDVDYFEPDEEDES